MWQEEMQEEHKGKGMEILQLKEEEKMGRRNETKRSRWIWKKRKRRFWVNPLSPSSV